MYSAGHSNPVLCDNVEEIEGRRGRWQQREMVGWHHQFNGHEFEQTLGDSEGQGGPTCRSPRGCKDQR